VIKALTSNDVTPADPGRSDLVIRALTSNDGTPRSTAGATW
jgi:hypothetical protein